MSSTAPIERPLVIVGAGPAGLSAAIAAVEAGLKPTLIDENPQIGGQIYRQRPAALQVPGEDYLPRRGLELLNRFRAIADQVELLLGANVWGCFPRNRLAVSRGDDWLLIDADQLILAPGAFEYVPPFPGWTLPGVMTPGGAQSMFKTMRAMPGQRALIAGSGPFLLVVAEQLHKAGVEIVGVIEASSMRQWPLAAPGLCSRPDLLLQGCRHLAGLRRAGIPVHRGHLVVEAQGEGEVREVTIAPCDARWYPDRSRSRKVAVDLLCVGYGFVPRTQISQLAGCRLRFDERLGGWAPERDENLATSVPRLWVAGDCGGVGGAIAAQFEGQLAAWSAARDRNLVGGKVFNQKTAPLRRGLTRLRRFRNGLDRLYRVQPGLNSLATSDTLVCRCEELTLADVEAGIASGGMDIRTLKVITRLGMGPCQGAMCWPATARRLAERLKTPIENVGPTSVRPPLQPVCLGALATTPITDPAVRLTSPLVEHSAESFRGPGLR